MWFCLIFYAEIPEEGVNSEIRVASRSGLVLWRTLDQHETCHAGRPRLWPHCVRWEPSSPPKGHSLPQFLARVCCGQTTEWIKTSHCVWWGHSSPPKTEGIAAPTLRSMSIVAIRLDGSRCYLVYEGRPRPRPHCVRWGTSSPERRTAPNFWPMSVVTRRHYVRWGPISHLKRDTAPTFRPMSIVAKRLDGSRCHLVRR